MKIMKIVVLLSLLLMATCFGLENRTATQLEQQLKVQKREKQYLIEDDPNEGPEQKRDERQSTTFKTNNNLDANGNSRIINIRLQPRPNILTPPKQGIKTGVSPKRIETTPQRIPTKIPVVLKTMKVVPVPAHAIRMKMLENKINQSISNAFKEKTLSQNNVAPPISMKDSIPYYNIEDKMFRRIESGLNPYNVNDENSNPESYGTSNKDVTETSGIVGKTPEHKDSNNFLIEGEHDQVTSKSDKKATEIKPINFFVDEPEPLPPSFRRQQKFEDTAPQSKEVTINKLKEIPIVKKGAIKPKKDELLKKENDNDDDNDPDIVRISNGTHIISIKKIQDPDKFITDRLLSRNGEELTVPTEERIVNQEPPKPKPVVNEPEKHTFSITEKFHTGKGKTVGLGGLVFKDNENMEEQDKNECIAITNNYEEIETTSLISTPLTLLPTNPPTYNEGNQETWNYLQNPYYNPYYQNIYDQYRQNHGLAQNIPNLRGQAIVDPKNYGAIRNCPYVYGQQNNDPTGSEITLPYYSNGKPATDKSSEYPYTPIAHEPQQETANVACALGSETHPENISERIWGTLNDMEANFRKGQASNAYEPLDIDIRRNSDGIGSGNKVDLIGKVANSYATSSLPISFNGALIYPYVNPGYRYMR